MAHSLKTFVQEHRSNNLLKIIVQEYGWVHLTIGLIGNLIFLVGSILFLPVFEPIKTFGVWLFILGAFLMSIGALGRLLVDLWNDPEAKARAEAFARRHGRPMPDAEASARHHGQPISDA
jgi:hypothetical protein